MSRRYGHHRPDPPFDDGALDRQRFGTRCRREADRLPECQAACCAPGRPPLPVDELSEPRWLLGASLLLIALTVARCAGGW